MRESSVKELNAMQAYEGYYENDRFVPLGRTVRVSERRRAFVTILDEPVREKPDTWAEFDKIVASMKEDEKPRYEDFPRCQVDRPLVDFGEH
jgi:hypothetical protein